MRKRTKRRLEDLEAAVKVLSRREQEMLKTIDNMEETRICNCNAENTVKIRIKYHSKEIKKLEYIDGKSDWIDLRSAENVHLKKGEHKLINLGISMELPAGYEGYVVPRSSSYKTFKIIEANHMAIFDESFKGDNDVWRMSIIALEDTEIHVNDRICQFRIQKHQPRIIFEEVEKLGNEDRGSIGSTGKN